MANDTEMRTRVSRWEVGLFHYGTPGQRERLVRRLARNVADAVALTRWLRAQAPPRKLDWERMDPY